MTTINELKLCEFVKGKNGETLKVVSLIDHPEDEKLLKVGFKDMAYTQRDVFTHLDLPRADIIEMTEYETRKVGRPSLVR